MVSSHIPHKINRQDKINKPTLTIKKFHIDCTFHLVLPCHIRSDAVDRRSSRVLSDHGQTTVWQNCSCRASLRVRQIPGQFDRYFWRWWRGDRYCRPSHSFGQDYTARYADVLSTSYWFSFWPFLNLLFSNEILKDPQVLQELIPFRQQVEAIAKKEIGKTLVFLDGSRLSCRMIECNLGNFIGDAYVDLVFKSQIEIV